MRTKPGDAGAMELEVVVFGVGGLEVAITGASLLIFHKEKSCFDGTMPTSNFPSRI